ncbi:DUF1778 domain-containing protein [Microbacterium marinilacus]|nr:DUF1778 domain-containing protein [Microbacterium marinilacus]MBY0688436.1 DUF1778 domain-containing protein [Microbacterium marinilacus]
MTSGLKDKRIELRLTSEQKTAIETAAAIQGRSLTDFSTDTLTNRAEEVIRRDRELQVDAARFDEFMKILDRPASSVDGLRELLSRKSVFVD